MSTLQQHFQFARPGVSKSVSSRQRPSQNHKVEILTEKYIKPSKTEENNKEDVWNVNPMDRMFMESDARVDLCWVFEGTIPVDKFEKSLSELLDEFRPFAGRYDAWKKCVRLSDRGIRFQVCQTNDFDLTSIVDRHFEEFFTPTFVDDRASLFAHARIYLVEQPLMTLRLTHLKDGKGCVLGLWMTHGLGDGLSFLRMINRLTELCLGKASDASLGILPQVPFPLDFSASLKEIKALIKTGGWTRIPRHVFVRGIYRNTRKGLSPFNRLRTAPFHLSKKALENMKVAAACDGQARSLASTAQLTSNDAVSAFVCQILARVFDFPDDQVCSHNLKLDWRGRLPELNDKWFGNASSGFVTCKFTPKASLGEIAGAINEGLAKCALDPEKMREHALLNWGRAKYKLVATMADTRTMPMMASKPSTFVINNLARFPVYFHNYGCGKPVLCVPQHTGDEVILWPRKDNDGCNLYFQGASALAISKLGEAGLEWLHQELGKFTNCDDVKTAFAEQLRNDVVSTGESPVVDVRGLVMVKRRPDSKYT